MDATRAGTDKKTALVLGGGGAYGVVQAAYVQALVERGFLPDLVVGTSVGALNGAWLALHPDRPQELLRIWLDLERVRLLHPNPLRLAGRVVRGRLGLWRNEIVPRLIAAHCAGRRFEDTQIPFAVVATNLTRARKQVFQQGDLGPAILASTAIPAVFEPVEIGGELFVDGGISASVDLATAFQLGATEILAIDLSPPPAPRRPRTPLGVVRSSFAALSRSATDGMVECLEGRVALRLTTPDLSQRSPWSLDLSAAAVAKNLAVAREAVQELVDGAGRVIPGLPARPVPPPAARSAGRRLRVGWQRKRALA